MLLCVKTSPINLQDIKQNNLDNVCENLNYDELKNFAQMNETMDHQINNVLPLTRKRVENVRDYLPQYYEDIKKFMQERHDKWKCVQSDEKYYPIFKCNSTLTDDHTTHTIRYLHQYLHEENDEENDEEVELIFNIYEDIGLYHIGYDDYKLDCCVHYTQESDTEIVDKQTSSTNMNHTTDKRLYYTFSFALSKRNPTSNFSKRYPLYYQIQHKRN
jgi:hypothetical protein